MKLIDRIANEWHLVGEVECFRSDCRGWAERGGHVSGVGSHLKSHVEKAKTRVSGFQWYVYTPQGDHIWTATWEDALNIGVHYARKAQLEMLR